MVRIELKKDLPKLDEQENVEDPIFYVRLISSGRVWYIAEYDEKERLCFGLFADCEPEFGLIIELCYFSLDELEKREDFIIVDETFEPKSLSEVKKEIALQSGR